MTWTAPQLPLTPKEVAEIYGISVSVVRKEIEKGSLKARHKRGQTKNWYITREAIEEWVQNGFLEDEVV